MIIIGKWDDGVSFLGKNRPFWLVFKLAPWYIFGIT